MRTPRATGARMPSGPKPTRNDAEGQSSSVFGWVQEIDSSENSKGASEGEGHLPVTKQAQAAASSSQPSQATASRHEQHQAPSSSRKHEQLENDQYQLQQQTAASGDKQRIYLKCSLGFLFIAETQPVCEIKLHISYRINLKIM